MSPRCDFNRPCHHRTDGTEGSDEDGQQTGCSSRGDRFTRRSGYPLRGRTDTLARVDTGRAVFRFNRTVPTNLGANGSFSALDLGTGGGDRREYRGRRALGCVSDRGSTVRSARRRARIDKGRRPLRVVARDIRRDGSWLGLVSRPSTSADTSLRQRDGVTRGRRRDRDRGDGRTGFGSTERPPCTGRRRTRASRSSRAGSGADPCARGSDCRIPASCNGSGS